MSTVQQAAEWLYSALSNQPKEKVIADVIVHSDLEKRLQISEFYEANFGKSLYQELKSKLSGNFRDIACHLFCHPITLMAKLLKKGLKGFSSDETVVYEILSSQSQDQLRQIEEAYLDETGKELKKDIEKNFSGTMKKHLLNLLYTPRREKKQPDQVECERKAEMLIKVGESNWINDEIVFKEVFIESSPEEMILISRYYLTKTNKNLLDVVEKKFSGKNKILLREVLFNNIIPHELYAEKIYLLLKGIGTNELLLNRVLILRSQIDMDEIREFYQWKYNVPMKDHIISDTSGPYQKVCVFLAES